MMDLSRATRTETSNIPEHLLVPILDAIHVLNRDVPEMFRQASVETQHSLVKFFADAITKEPEIDGAEPDCMTLYCRQIPESTFDSRYAFLPEPPPMIIDVAVQYKFFMFERYPRIICFQHTAQKVVSILVFRVEQNMDFHTLDFRNERSKWIKTEFLKEFTFKPQ